MKAKDAVKYIVSFALAGLLLWLAFRNVDDWSKFWRDLTSCKWEFLLMSMLIGILSFFARSVRWKMLIDPLDNTIGLGHVFNAINISYLFNMVIPRGGDVIRCYYIAKHSQNGPDGKKKASFDKVLGTAILDRLWDVVFLMILLVAVLFLMWNRFGDFVGDVYEKASVSRTIIIVGITGVIAGVVLIYLLWKFKDRSSIAAKVWRFIAGIWEGIGTCLKMKQGWKFIVYTLLVWACYCFMSATIMWALDADTIYGMNLMDALFLCAVGAVSNMVPVPGGFGAFHSLVGFALSTIYGIPIDVALVFATLSHGVQAVGQVLCGGVSYIIEMKY